MEQFIGIQIQISIVKILRYNMYLTNEARHDTIASIITIKYQKPKQC